MKIYWFFLTDFGTLLEQLLPLLTEEEKQKSDRFYFDYLRQRYQISHGILRLTLSQHLNYPPQEIEFTYTEKGKPLIAPHCNLHGLNFNLSHSKDIALIGMSYSGKIGVDVEYQQDKDTLLSLAKRFFSEQDYQFLKNTPIENQQHLFFQLWTAKEAYLKATGEGISGGLDRVQVTFSPARFITLDGSSEKAEKWNLFSFELTENYQAAIALEKNKFDSVTDRPLIIQKLQPNLTKFSEVRDDISLYELILG